MADLQIAMCTGLAKTLMLFLLLNDIQTNLILNDHFGLLHFDIFYLTVFGETQDCICTVWCIITRLCSIELFLVYQTENSSDG